MCPYEFTRRGFLATVGLGAAVVAAGSALSASPFGPGVTQALADDRNNLEALVNLRFGMFNHFNLGTFTDEEWAAPNQSPALFAPTAVNCEQWADAAKAAGMSYGVLTTKHHDGFALWPTAYGEQNVMHSPYPHDIVQQYVDAFRSRGLRVGIYFSIWDRTAPVQSFGGHVGDTTQSITPGNMAYVLGQITELLSNYGEIDMFITDGYAWQMGQQALQYQQVRNHVKSLQPNIVMVDHGGLSQPWLGDAIYFEEPLGVRSPAGNTYASLQGQTISNGWFWHPSTPAQDPMAKDDILAHLSDLEPKYTSFILNCPPNRDGVLDANIVNRLAEVGAAWTPDLNRAPLPTQPLKVEWPVTPVAAYATGNHDGEPAFNAIDGRSDSGFETCWSTWSPTPGTGALALPQAITIDLGGLWSNVTSLQYLPKQFNRSGTTDGDITAYTVAVSTDGVTFTDVDTGTWPPGPQPKISEWARRDVAFVRLTASAATGDYANAGGFIVGGRLEKPVRRSSIVATDRTYRLVNRNSGKVLDAGDARAGNGSPVVQTAWSDADGQKFTLAETGDGYYTLRAQSNGALVEVANRSRDEGAPLGIWTEAEVFSQHWAVTPVGGGSALLTNRFSSKVMTIDNASTAEGAHAGQGQYDGAAEQQWQLVAINAPTPTPTPTPTSSASPTPSQGSGSPASPSATAAALVRRPEGVLASTGGAGGDSRATQALLAGAAVAAGGVLIARGRKRRRTAVPEKGGEPEGADEPLI